MRFGELRLTPFCTHTITTAPLFLLTIKLRFDYLIEPDENISSSIIFINYIWTGRVYTDEFEKKILIVDYELNNRKPTPI